ncbi:unnamed protein product [Phytophthora fragariaefolia]|uniref:Unnamed protein product n=1 Tax=Phytophthora fragariaefolia TaxID=1490495 RepID=A0A9W6U9T5_9STRA|nr:unnamed protein product [Phytophthora fragariaefolia]
MYEGTSWATDISNGMTTITNKTTSTTQTDSPESAETLKKTLIYENSKINPELSTTGTNTDPLEVNATPVMIDTGISVKPDTRDATATAKPSMSDAGISVKPTIANVGIDNSVRMKDAESSTNTAIMDREDQVASRNWIKAFFKSNPNWASIGINPVKRDGNDGEKRVIRETGSIRSVKTGRKYQKCDSFDWVATESKIRDIFYNGESNSIDEVGAMRSEDKPLRSDRKRKGGDDIEDLDIIKDPRLDLKFLDKSTSTELDNDEAKYKRTWFIIQNKNLLLANKLERQITPVLKNGKEYRGGYLRIDDKFRIDVFRVDSNKHHPAVQKDADWIAPLERFLSITKEKGLSLVSNTGMANEKKVKPYGLAENIIDERPGVKAGREGYMDKNLHILEIEAKTILTDYYLGELTIDKPLNLRNGQHKQVKGDAMSHLMKTIRWMDTFESLLTDLEDYVKYVGESEDRNLEKILDDILRLLREATFTNVYDVKTPLGYDDSGYDELKKSHDEAEAAFRSYGEAYSQLEKTLSDFNKSNSEADKQAVRASRSAVKATKAAYSIKIRAYNDKLRERDEVDQMGSNDTPLSASVKSKIERANTRANFKHLPQGSGLKRKLKGRGLKGAGVAPLEGVVRRGRTYNLNEIQGLATPSAYTYKQLGRKYIRIPDLDAKTLVIVQPNRRKCGPKCKISDSLQSMIKTLVYKQHIDQAAYDKLNIDDKKLFKEIRAITHLQYNFHDKLTDPLETLRAEYDKLKGEMELGNDNPSIVKQLKSLTTMFFFNPRIISSSSGSYGDNADLNVAELKAIMKNLIIHDRPQKTQAAVWATDLDKSIEKVDASTQTEGGRVWAYQPKKKKTVKTFSL